MSAHKHSRMLSEAEIRHNERVARKRRTERRKLEQLTKLGQQRRGY